MCPRFHLALELQEIWSELIGRLAEIKREAALDGGLIEVTSCQSIKESQ